MDMNTYTSIRMHHSKNGKQFGLKSGAPGGAIGPGSPATTPFSLEAGAWRG
jgi:hypothetical protein